MNSLLRVSVTIALLSCVVSKKIKTTNRLYKHLLSGYDQLLRPTENTGNATTVNFDIMLKDINNIKEGTLESEIKASVWVSMQWTDPRLAWDLARFPTKTFVINPNKLWIPDIRLYNSLDPKIRIDDKVKAVIKYDGRVHYVIPMWLMVHCLRPRVTNRATWECPFRFGSWVYNGYQLDIYIRNDGLDLSDYSNKVWGITGNDSIRRAITRQCCREPWPEVTYTLRVIRR